MTGAVISFDPESPDSPDLLPPEGRTQGAEMADAIANYLEDAQAKVRIAYMDEVMKSGGTYDRYGFDYSVAAHSAVPPEMFPPKLIIKTGGVVPDFYSNFGFWFVTDAFKSLVEEFDGNIHQFVPVEITDESGAPYDRSSVFYFKCRQVLNTVDETSEALNFLTSKRTKPGDPTGFTFTSNNPFRMFKDKIGTAGIWQELRCPRSLFASDGFLRRVAAQNLTGVFRYTDFEEV